MLDNINFTRHDLLELAPDCQITADAENLRIIREWLQQGRPVIIRRPCQTLEGLHSGIPLPPGQGWRRIAFTTGPGSVKKRLALPRLRDCLQLLPEERQSSLISLVDLNPEVFGSLAWQFLTGMPYLRKESDADLLFRVDSQRELRDLTAELNLAAPGDCCDIEIMLWNGRAFSWREFTQEADSLLLKADYDVFSGRKKNIFPVEVDAGVIAWEAESALHEELETYPKPGLVSYVDNGSHSDMNAGHFRSSIGELRGYFKSIAEAGAGGADMAELRRLGIDAENRVLAATGGVNTHRGAIFSLGMLAAAAGHKFKNKDESSLGEIIKNLWGMEIEDHLNPGSNGELAVKRYGGGCARTEVASGLPSVYKYGLPALQDSIGKYSRNSARLNSFYAMLEHVNDTTLLHRGGRDGQDFAVNSAVNFNHASKGEKAGLALRNHREFIKRGLSCGGVADLLAAAVFIHRMEELWLEL